MTTDKKTINNIAWACHEINRIFCQVHGDGSQKPWTEAPEWQKESARQGVEYALENPDITSEMLHESWLDLKIKDGWEFGETKDPEKKTHPCMVPYKDLSKEQQAKDTLFRTIVHSFL